MLISAAFIASLGVCAVAGAAGWGHMLDRASSWASRLFVASIAGGALYYTAAYLEYVKEFTS